MVAHNFNTNTLEANMDLWDQPGLQRTSNDSLKYPLRVCLPRPPKVVNRKSQIIANININDGQNHSLHH